MKKELIIVLGFIIGLVMGALITYAWISPIATESITQECPEFKLRTYFDQISGYRDTVKMVESTNGNSYPKLGDSIKIKKGDIFYAVAMAGYYPKMPENGRYHLWPVFTAHAFVHTLKGGESALIQYATDTVDMNGKKIKEIILPSTIETYKSNSEDKNVSRDTFRFYVVD